MMPKSRLVPTELQVEFRSVILGVEDWPDDELAPQLRVAAPVLPYRMSAESDTALWVEDGAGGDKTVIVPPVAAPAPALAWSVDEDETVPMHQSWASVWGRAAVMVTLAAAVAVVIGLLGWIAFHQDSSAPVSVPSTMPAAALPPISTPVPTTTVTVAAQAPTPAFSGRYIVIETAPTGRTAANIWDVNPCGDGCADIADTADGGRSGGRALLANGQWAFDLTLKAICADGSSVLRAGSGHFTISADTLRGTVRASWTKEACGLPPAVVTHNISMTRENQ
jgi:hypothetical protein